MVLYLGFLLILALWGAKYHFREFHKDYISAAHTQCIKGIFIMLVFATHFVRYNVFNGLHHDLYFQFRSYMDQLVVVPFLFYSGYGVAESIRSKGKSYLRAFPRTRVLSTFLQFFAATVLYFVFRCLQGNAYTVEQVLLAFTGYFSLGNGSWYIFTILVLYLLTWLCFTLFPKHSPIALSLLTLGTAAYVLFMRNHAEPYFYNTAAAYVAGCWFSLFRSPYERYILRSKKRFFFVCVLCALAFLFCFRYRRRLAYYEGCSVLLALIIVLFTSVVEIRNPFLQYCGKHVFSLYILHHIPMILLQKAPLCKHWLVHLIISLLFTFLLGWLFDRYVSAPINRLCRLSQKKRALG